MNREQAKILQDFMNTIGDNLAVGIEALNTIAQYVENELMDQLNDSDEELMVEISNIVYDTEEWLDEKAGDYEAYRAEEHAKCSEHTE